MRIKELTFDYWKGKRLHRTMYDPEVTEIESAVRSLDAESRTEITLIGSDGRMMGIGGGNGHFLVLVQSDPVSNEQCIWTLLNANAEPGTKVEHVVGGQWGVYDSKYLVSSGDVFSALSVFLGRPSPNPDLTWELQHDGKILTTNSLQK